METRIVRCEENIDEMKVKSSKKLTLLYFNDR